MTQKRIALIGFIFVACLAGYLTLRTERLPTPASHEDAPATAMGSLHLLQANVPF